MKKRITLFLAFLLLVGTLGGCKKTADRNAEISMALSNAPVTIDPQLVTDTGAGFVASFYTACLYGYNTNRELEPILAESCEISDDGLTHTFHLREGLKWSDGRPLTASDFVYGFQRLADPDLGSNAVYLITDSCVLKNAIDVTTGKKPVSELGVSAPDDRTFVVELEIPCPYFCALLTMCNFAPCNEDFYHSVGADYATSEETILSCGPYVLDRYEPLAMQIHLKKNPSYVNADRVTVPGINLQVVANAQQGLMGYESGYLDMVSVSGELADLAEGDPELTDFPTASLFYLDLSSRGNEALGNRNIRMALQKSIDREDLVKNLLKTGFTEMSRINPPGYYLQFDNTDFSKDEDRYKEQSGYDPAKAKELWSQGLSELSMTSVSLTLIAASGNNNVLEAVKAQLENNLPGLTVNLKLVTQKESLTAKQKGDYDMMLAGWVADYADPTAFLALFISSASAKGYSNPEYDALYQEIQNFTSVHNLSERDDMMHKAEDILMDDAAAIPLFSKGNAYLIRKELTGFQITPTGVGCIVTDLRKEVE